MRLPALILIAAALAACEPASSGADARVASDAAVEVARAAVATSRQRIVDSALSIDEQMRRFRATIDGEPARLEGGERSRDALVRSFGAAVARRDTAALRRLHLSRAEFAYLYFPTNPVARPPYELDPALLWFRLSGESEKGMSRLLERFGGEGFRLAGHECKVEPELQGRNRLWGPCVTRFVISRGDTLSLQLFGPIVERDGRFKFVSYFNKL